jgi:dTDP-4-amino-4,6-dideoxygalactose transaminase
VPQLDPGHVYHLFVVHYPVSIARQPMLADAQPADCPQAVRACDEVLSLPLHPGLPAVQLRTIAAAVRAFAED